MINRAAVILRYREPALEWLNQVDPYQDGSEVTWEDTDNESTVYLVSPDDTESWDTVEEWVIINYRSLFEAELEDWNVDPTLWPADRGYQTFRDWFYVEVHTVVVDTVGDRIHEDDDLLPPRHLDS